MTTEIRPGDVLKSNDPREGGRTLTVEHVADGYAHCASPRSARRTRIRLDRIYTDGKHRKSGYRLANPLADTLASIRRTVTARHSAASQCLQCGLYAPPGLCLYCLRRLAIKQGADPAMLRSYINLLFDAATEIYLADEVESALLTR